MIRKKITTGDDEIITKGFLKDFLKRELEKFTRVILGEIADLNGRFQKNTDIVVGEIQALRSEIREINQTKDALQRNDIIQERKIDALDERVLKLETARK